MENLPELALGITALVYASSLIIWKLPLGFFKRYGWQSMMHSWSSIAVISVVGSLSMLKALLSPYIENLLGINLDATFGEAFSSINMYRDMVQQHINAVNLSALVLGSSMAIMLLALSVASISGVGILVMSIASYLVSAVFGLLLLIQKTLSAVLLFADAIMSITVIASVAGLGMFMAGLVLYSIPFARKLGKTLLVVGAGFTLALPVVITQALPSPAEAQEQIEKSREVQAYSIALQTIKNWQGGVRINLLDRNGTVLLKGGGEEFHESRVIHYPYFKLELKSFNLGMIDCSNVTLPTGITCEKIAEAVSQMIATPEKGFIDTRDEKYNSYENGYRTLLTMPDKHRRVSDSGPNPWREATYLPDSWILGMWIYMQGQSGKRDQTVKLIGYEIPGEPPNTDKLVCSDVTCWYETVDPYEAWKQKWEEYWQTTKYYKLYAENMVQEGEKTSFVWFTNKPVSSDSPLNRFLIFPPVQELRCVVTGVEKKGNETVYKYGIVVKTGEKTVTYFAYLDEAEYTVEGDPSIEIREVDVGELVGEVVKNAGSLNLKPSIEIIGGGPELSATPPAHYMEVYYPGGETIYGEGYSCEEAMAQYINSMIQDLHLEDNSTNPYVDDYRECYENELNRYMNGTDNIPEPGNSTSTNSTDIGLPPCVQQGAAMPIYVTVYFTLLKESPLAPWIAQVEWEAFDKDEEYFKNVANGEYFDENAINGVDIETHREEWAGYPIFRQGLYRDGPVHSGQRLVVARLQEYKSMSWEENILAKEVFKMLNSIIEKSSKNIPGGPVPIPVAGELLGDGESVGMINIVKVAGYTIALAYGLLLFVVGLDTVSWFIGGESFGKKLVGGISSVIYQTYSGAGAFIHSMRGKNIPSMIARKEAKTQQDKMVKTLIEERKKDRERMRKMVEKRIAEERGKILGKIRSGMLKTSSEIYEKILDKAEELEKKGLLGRIEARLLREASRDYILRLQAYNLMRDPEYAKKYLDQSVYVKQSKHAMIGNREWAEGFSKMLRDNPLSRRIALVDQFAREGWKVGEKWVLNHLSPTFTDKISAPASFKVAFEMSKPFSDPSRGHKPSMPYAYTPDFTISLWRYRFPPLQEVVRGVVGGELPKFLKISRDASDIPYIQSSKDISKLGREVYDAVRSYQEYVRRLSHEESSNLSESLLKQHLEPLHLDANAPLIDKNAVEVCLKSSWRGEEAKLPFEIDSRSLDAFEPVFQKNSIEIVESKSLRDLTVQDSQEYGLVEGLQNLTPFLSGDVKKSFWWLDDSRELVVNASGDALDWLSHEGYTFSEAWSNMLSDQPDWGQGIKTDPHVRSSNEGGWWK